MFAFPPLIDVKIDQPSSEIELDREKVAELGLDLQTVGAGPRIGARRQLRQPLQHRRAQLQGDPAAPALRAPEPGAAQGHLRHRSERAARLARLHRHAAGRRHAALAQPLPAAQRGEDQRRRDPPARPGARVPGGRGREDPARGLHHRLHGRVAPAAHRGEQVPAGVPARGGADLPGARRAVQQLPRSVRDPRRLGAARHVRRARA